MPIITGNTLQEIINAFTTASTEDASWQMGPMTGLLSRRGSICEMKNSRGVTIHKWEA